MTTTMDSRSDHLAWCKKRALDILKSGDRTGAWASFVSDMGKHPETIGHIALPLGMSMFASGMLSSSAEMQKFIEDFN